MICVLYGHSVCSSQDFESLEPYLKSKQGDKLALVVGNWDYTNPNISKIPGVKHDVHEVTHKLETLGFAVTSQLDVPDGIIFQRDVLAPFRSKVKRGDLVLIYLSGHGFSWSGENYFAGTIMPTPLKEARLFEFATPILSVADYVSEQEPGGLILVIDACRTIAGFIERSDGADFQLKGNEQPDEGARPDNSNYTILWAQKQGFGALVPPDSASLYTKNLLKYIDRENTLLDILLRDVAVDVQEESGHTQFPGASAWSNADLYLRTNEQFNAQSKELWLSILTTQDPVKIRRFVTRNALNPYVVSAIKWLDDHRQASARLTSYTRVSPNAVLDAGNTAGNDAESAAIRLSSLSQTAALRFQRQASMTIPHSIQTRLNLEKMSAEVMQSNEDPSNNPAIGEALNAASLLASSGATVIASSSAGRIEPSKFAPQNTKLKLGEVVEILDVTPDLENQSVWIKVANRKAEIGYFEVTGEDISRSDIVIGHPVSKIQLEPLADGLTSLLDPKPLLIELARLRADGIEISWAGISGTYNPGLGEAERSRRNERELHARYLLTVNGIDSKIITIAPRFVDDIDISPAITIDLFGYKGK